MKCWKHIYGKIKKDSPLCMHLFKQKLCFALASKVEDILNSPTTAAESSRLAIQLSAGLSGSFYHLQSVLS